MNKKMKKFFVLKNIKSQFIDQAIFVLKEKSANEQQESDVIKEAESIIENYLVKMGYEKGENSKSKKLSVIFNLSIVLFVITAIYTIVRIV